MFGPRAGDPNLADDVYDAAAGNWDNYRDDLPNVPIGTNPSRMYARGQDGVSLGYLDDACDGIIEVKLRVNGVEREAHAHVASGPPDFAPDSYHVRTVSDELEQILQGHEIPGNVPRAEMIDIIRRALETVRLMNTEAMNGSPPFLGTTSNMSGHDANPRALEPIFNPVMVDEAQVRSFHTEALAALLGGEQPWFVEYSPPTGECWRPDQRFSSPDAGDDARRRCGASNANTQADRKDRGGSRRPDIRRTGRRKRDARVTADTAENDMRALIAHFRNRAPLHRAIDVDGGGTLAELFADDTRLINYVKTAVAKGDEAGPVKGQPLVVPGDLLKVPSIAKAVLPRRRAFQTFVVDTATPQSLVMCAASSASGTRGIPSSPSAAILRKAEVSGPSVLSVFVPAARWASAPSSQTVIAS